MAAKAGFKAEMLSRHRGINGKGPLAEGPPLCRERP
jgi:hypothetical protein